MSQVHKKTPLNLRGADWDGTRQIGGNVYLPMERS